jgi:quercetin dioxygenase-like cupin family protein
MQFGYAVYLMMPLLFGLLLAFAADDRVKIDNDVVRVLDVVDEPHHPSALHRHEMSRVMIYLTAGDQTIRHQDGPVDKQHWNAGQVAWSPAGGLHISENVGEKPLRIIEVELKKTASKAPPRNLRLDPVAIDPAHNILLFENAQVRVFRRFFETRGSEKVPEHSGADCVTVFLTDLDARRRVDGQSIWLRGEAGGVFWNWPGKGAGKITDVGKIEMIVVEVY